MDNDVIRIVYGNVLAMGIRLTERIVTMHNGEVEYEDVDFIPSDEYPVNVEFGWNGQTIAMDVEMQGNIAYVQDNGTLPVGTWSVTITCKDDNGNPHRFKQKAVVRVYDVTADAGIQQPIEFESKVWYLNGAIFLTFGGGNSGGETDPSVPDYIKAITQEMISAWNAKYTKPSNGIPKTDLENAVQESLGKADTALQEHQSLSGLATIAQLQSLQNSLNTLMNNDDVENIINSFNEVVDFLSGVTNDETLAGLLNEMRNSINAKYTKPNGGIPATDLEGGIPTSKINGLHPVATSGDYNDLGNKPTIPVVPTNISSFNNDTGYLTQHQSLANYYTKSEIDAKVSMPIVSLTPTNGAAALESDKYYLLGSVGSSTAVDNLLTLSFETSSTKALTYMGRFTAIADELSLVLPPGIHFTDSVPSIEAGHSYEFNILYDVCLLTDITFTAS